MTNKLDTIELIEEDNIDVEDDLLPLDLTEIAELIVSLKEEDEILDFILKMLEIKNDQMFAMDVIESIEEAFADFTDFDWQADDVEEDDSTDDIPPDVIQSEIYENMHDAEFNQF